jgi:hypothetical protein
MNGQPDFTQIRLPFHNSNSYSIILFARIRLAVITRETSSTKKSIKRET